MFLAGLYLVMREKNLMARQIKDEVKHFCFSNFRIFNAVFLEEKTLDSFSVLILTQNKRVSQVFFFNFRNFTQPNIKASDWL